MAVLLTRLQAKQAATQYQCVLTATKYEVTDVRYTSPRQRHQQLGQLLGQPDDIVDHRAALNSLRPRPAGMQPGFVWIAPISQCPGLANRDGQG